MRRLTDTDGLSDVQRDILRTVRDFVDAEVLPGCGVAHRAFELAVSYARSRDAPMLLIGEGTSEIQKMIIGQRLVSAY